MTTKKSPFKNLKLLFVKKKGKEVGESITSLNEEDPKKEDTEYETKFEEESEQESEPDNTMGDITDIPMGEYKRRMRVDIRPGLVQPAIPATTNFELKGHILTQLKEIPFYGKYH